MIRQTLKNSAPVKPVVLAVRTGIKSGTPWSA